MFPRPVFFSPRIISCREIKVYYLLLFKDNMILIMLIITFCPHICSLCHISVLHATYLPAAYIDAVLCCAGFPLENPSRMSARSNKWYSTTIWGVSSPCPSRRDTEACTGLYSFLEGQRGPCYYSIERVTLFRLFHGAPILRSSNFNLGHILPI